MGQGLGSGQERGAPAAGAERWRGRKGQSGRETPSTPPPPRGLARCSLRCSAALQPLGIPVRQRRVLPSGLALRRRGPHRRQRRAGLRGALCASRRALRLRPALRVSLPAVLRRAPHCPAGSDEGADACGEPARLCSPARPRCLFHLHPPPLLDLRAHRWGGAPARE